MLQPRHRLHDGQQLRAHVGGGLTDLAWYAADGTALAHDRWHDHGDRAFAMQLAGPSGGGIEVLRVLMNPSSGPVTFALPGGFRLLLDTTTPDAPEAGVADRLVVAAHALALVARRQGGA